MGTDLRVGLSSLKWVIDAYALALATTVLTIGSLADRFGRRRAFACGLTVFTVAALACALAGSVVALDAARAVQGIGASALFARRRWRCWPRHSPARESEPARWPRTARRSAARSRSARSSAAR